jgi:hypothetical protein
LDSRHQTIRKNAKPPKGSSHGTRRLTRGFA